MKIKTLSRFDVTKVILNNCFLMCCLLTGKQFFYLTQFSTNKEIFFFKLKGDTGDYKMEPNYFIVVRRKPKIMCSFEVFY